jgi:hypothetical protein
MTDEPASSVQPQALAPRRAQATATRDSGLDSADRPGELLAWTRLGTVRPMRAPDHKSGTYVAGTDAARARRRRSVLRLVQARQAFERSPSDVTRLNLVEAEIEIEDAHAVAEEWRS